MLQYDLKAGCITYVKALQIVSIAKDRRFLTRLPNIAHAYDCWLPIDSF